MSTDSHIKQQVDIFSNDSGPTLLDPPLPERGEQAGTVLKAGIIGGGKACLRLLNLIDGELGGRIKLEILGVADPDPEAPGLILARERGLFTTADMTALYDLPGLNMLIELTGSAQVRSRMIRTKPLEISSMDHRGARLLWDLATVEMEKSRLQRRAQERAKADRAWLGRILDSLPDRVMVVDGEKHVLLVNRTYVNMTGLPRGKVIGHNCEDVCTFRTGTCTALTCPLEQARITGRQSRVVRRFVRPTGEEGIEEVIASLLWREDREDEQYLISLRDITDRVKLESELRETEQTLRRFFEVSDDLIYIKDPAGRYRYLNPVGLELFGLTGEAIIGKTDAELLPPRAAAQRNQAFETVVQAKEHLCFSDRMELNGRTRYFRTEKYPILDDSGQVIAVCGLSRDVTEELNLHNKLIASERLAAMGQAAAGLAHFIKNILNSLKGGAFMIDAGLKRPDNKLIEQGQRIIQRNITAVTDLTQDMLSYAKDRQPELASVRPAELVNEAFDLVVPAARLLQVELRVEADSDLPPVQLDRKAINRCLVNLAVNAFDACLEKPFPEGQAGRVVMAAVRRGEELLLSVSDNGVGMTDAVKARLFEGFFSTKKSRGTGLGLTVTVKTVREHGGRIEVDSAPDQGSRFTIVLPYTE